MRLIRTSAFDTWLAELRDVRGKAAIARRLTNFERGVLGDVKSVGDGVMEARIPLGPGYRLYFLRQQDVLVVFLCGGDKSSQRRDIKAAIEAARDWSRP